MGTPSTRTLMCATLGDAVTAIGAIPEIVAPLTGLTIARPFAAIAPPLQSIVVAKTSVPASQPNLFPRI
jgi:hypothetical protein